MRNKISYQIAGILLIIATLGFTFTYFYQKNIKKQQEIAVEEAKEKAAQVSKKVEPKSKEVDMAALEKERMNISEEISPVEETEPIAETANTALHFPEQIAWPMEGKVLLNYSMDQTVYFPTLKQYQYNPAVIIGAKVNDKVNSACEGKVISILNDAKTGTSVTVDAGDGYELLYGQLKEVKVATGDIISKGQCIGYINEPSKYFLEEGPNLYFQVKKDGTPVNPQDYLEQ